MNFYDQQAADFLAKTGSTLTITFKELVVEPDTLLSDDNFTACKARLAFNFTLARGRRSYSGTFTGSIRDCYEALVGEPYPARMTLHTEAKQQLAALAVDRGPDRWGKRGTLSKDLAAPRPYDILACLQKHEVSSSVDEWAREYGYTLEDGKTTIAEILKVHQACLAEYAGVVSLYDDEELAALSEIN